MSCTELHTGRFKIIAKGDNEINEYLEKNGLKQDFDIDTNRWGDLVFWSNNENYSVLVVKNTNILIKFIEHAETDETDFFSQMLKTDNDGEYSFVSLFYNGGTCLSEMLEYELEKII